jgi:4-hydroxy-tetrahydrodipicolinate synthase
MSELKGTMTAIVTPFKNGKFDSRKFAELVNRQVDAGIDGIVPVGTTGESATLDHKEHREVIKVCVDVVKGRTKVFAGTGSNSTDEALSLTKYAEEAGCDGALMVSPYYNKPSNEGIYQHYKAVAESVGIPIILYSIPSRTGREIAIETLKKLSDIKNIVALKEAGGSVDRVSDIISSCRMTVLSGDDSLTLPFMSVGAKGVISVVSNMIPKDVKAMVDAVFANKWDDARKLHYKMLPFVRECFRECNPSGIKCAMKLAGIISDEMRLPLVPYLPENEAKMKEVLKQYGILRS